MEQNNNSQSEKDCSCASPINCQRLANIIGGVVITATPEDYQDQNFKKLKI